LLGWGILALAVPGILYALFAAVQVRRFGRIGVANPDSRPSVTVLKPLYGNEPGLAQNLMSFCTQPYAGDMQIVCGVQDPADGAIPAVETVRAAGPRVAPELVVDSTRHGANLKVGNLINMSRRSRHEIIVLADSDMRVPPAYLDAVIATLLAPGTGAVTCLYQGLTLPEQTEGRLWSRLAALQIDLHFLPSVLVGVGLGLARPCFGSTIALRRQTPRPSAISWPTIMRSATRCAPRASRSGWRPW
jgi:ceramide glucosyltransferase